MKILNKLAECKQWIIRIVMVRFISWYEKEPPSIAISNAQIFWFVTAIVIAVTVKILQVTDVLGVWIINEP